MTAKRMYGVGVVLVLLAGVIPCRAGIPLNSLVTEWVNAAADAGKVARYSVVLARPGWLFVRVAEAERVRVRIDGEEVLAEVRAAAQDDPDIHILVLPPDAHRKINALQRYAECRAGSPGSISSGTFCRPERPRDFRIHDGVPWERWRDVALPALEGVH